MPDYVDMLKKFSLNDHHGMVNRFSIKVIAPNDVDLGTWGSVSGIEMAFDPVEYRVGDGDNARWYGPGLSKYKPIVLKRTIHRADTEKVRKWFSETAFQYQPGHLTIQLNDPMSSEVHTWEMRGAMAKRWAIDNLDASANKLATETLEIEHLGFLDDDVVVAEKSFTETTAFAMSMRFEVKVGGMDLGGWQGCTGLTVNFNLKELQSGGQNDNSFWVANQIKYPKVTLKRAMTTQDSAAVQQWLSTFVGDDTIEGQTSTITLRDGHGKVVCSWDLRNTMPLTWSGPPMDSTKSGVAIETLELVHEGFL
jgi:phage tail-like protein